MLPSNILQHRPKGQVPALLQQYATKLNTLRFIAIASVVWGHTLLGWENQHFTYLPALMVQAVFMQLGRMGTIIFFIISGFFLTERLPRFTIGSYLRYRWQSVILPWLFFILLCVLLQSFQVYFNTGLLPSPGKLLAGTIFHAAYWFIPVSLFAACFLIASKKYLHTSWFALLLVACTIFYCINLYYRWVAVNHTKAVLGYTLFTWLGVQFHRHVTTADRLLKRISWALVLPVMLVLFFVSCWEAVYLKTRGCADAFASIRVSNILLSLTVFVVFVKIKPSVFIEKIKPQKYVYGVYLIHSVVLLELLPLLLRPLQKQSIFKVLPVAVTIQLAAFVIVTALSYSTAILLKKSKLHRLVGR